MQVNVTEGGQWEGWATAARLQKLGLGCSDGIAIRLSHHQPAHGGPASSRANDRQARAASSPVPSTTDTVYCFSKNIDSTRGRAVWTLETVSLGLETTRGRMELGRRADVRSSAHTDVTSVRVALPGQAIAALASRQRMRSRLGALHHELRHAWHPWPV